MLLQGVLHLSLLCFGGLGYWLLVSALLRFLAFIGIWVDLPDNLRWLVGPVLNRAANQTRLAARGTLWVHIVIQLFVAAVYGYFAYALFSIPESFGRVGFVFLVLGAR